MVDLPEAPASPDEGFVEVVNLIRAARLRSLQAVNTELIDLYWQVGAIISRKIAATFSSTGTPAFFLHPAEAIHGDLGAIRDDDVVVALSHGGETGELLRLLESIRRIGAKLIAITG